MAEAFADGATAVDHAALAATRVLGVEVVNVSLSDLPYGALMNIVVAEAAGGFDDLTLSGLDDTLTGQEVEAWPNTLRKARFLSAVDPSGNTFAVQQGRSLWGRLFDEGPMLNLIMTPMNPAGIENVRMMPTLRSG